MSGSYSGSSYSVARYGTSEVEVIESGEYVYIVERVLKWRWNKTADVTVNAPIRFAVDKQTMYVLDDEQHEHKTKIIKRILRARSDVPATAVTKIEAPSIKKTGEPLDNKAVIEMVSRGLSENSIVATIKERPGSYALYPDAVLPLRKSGVPQAVIVAMSVNNDNPVLGPTP